MKADITIAVIVLAILHTLVVATSEKGATSDTLTTTSATTGKRFRMSKVSLREEVEASLMKELAGTFREGRTKDHIMEIKAKLMPLFKVVPQGADGTVPHSVVRYVLHRFFVQDRGWFVRGLEPHASPENKADASAGHENKTLGAVQEWVPMYLHQFLEQLHGGRGIGVNELAVLAAALEDLVHKEALGNLDKLLRHYPRPNSEDMYNESVVQDVLEMYMFRVLRGKSFASSVSVKQERRAYIEENLDWEQLVEWVRGLRKELIPSGSANKSSIMAAVEAMGERYTVYHDTACAKMKSELLDLESSKPARVRLNDFYKNKPLSIFYFRESLDYLRALGAVDMSDPEDPHVIIPNYMTGRSNCMMVSKLYGICCRDECQALRGKLEDEIKDELADPAQILKLVAALPSDTVQAPRKLSSALTQRLYAIASQHEGHVPMHGRLFAQWMHHAFPRECSFPHEKGRIRPQTPEEWYDNHKTYAILSEKQIADHLRKEDKDKRAQANEILSRYSDESELPWTDSEELLLPMKKVPTNHTLRTVMVFITLASMAYGVKSKLFSSESTSTLPQWGKSKLV